MARVNYHDILTQIQSVLDADADVDALTFINLEPNLDPMTGNKIYIYEESRTAPENLQRISAGRRTSIIYTVSIWCLAFSLDSVDHASQLRDDLVGFVEIALMNNRDLNNTVHTLWLNGGAFDGAPLDNGFTSAAETMVEIRIDATV